jgi:hypothetical protein
MPFERAHAVPDRYGWLTPPTSARPGKRSVAVIEEAQEEAHLEAKWLGILKHFRAYRSKNKGSYIRNIRRGIPDSLRGRVWLYIVHKQSEQLDQPLNRGSKTRSVKDNRMSRYRYYLNKRALETPGLLVCPWLPGVTDPAFLAAVQAVVIAYLNADRRVSYHPAMGYIASLFVAYMPVASAWTALVHLMSVGKQKAHDLFLTDELADLLLVWDYFVSQKVPEFKTKLTAFHIRHEDYAVEWFQSVFLSVPFLGTLSLGIFDEFVAFGPRALIMTGIMVVRSMLRRLLAASKEKLLAALKNPATDFVFANGRSTLARLGATFISKAEYRKAWTIVDPGRPVPTKRKKLSK